MSILLSKAFGKILGVTLFCVMIIFMFSPDVKVPSLTTAEAADIRLFKIKPIEICHDEVLYLQFYNTDNYIAVSVKYNKDGTVATCK